MAFILWIRFSHLCNIQTQKAIFEEIRPKIRIWEQANLIQGAILTYHTDTYPGDLYVCLNIPSVKKPSSDERSRHLSREIQDQIPNEIIDEIKRICARNQIATEYDPKSPPDKRLIIIDYEYNLIKSKSSRLYRDAPISEILRFASTGTEIALRVLEDKEISKYLKSSEIRNIRNLATYIYSSLKKKFGNDYFWLPEAFHFVCNPLLKTYEESYLYSLAVRK